MNKEKKNFFTLKRLFVIGVIILLVLAMSPLFWRNMIMDSLEPYRYFTSIHENTSDSKIVVLIEQKYNRNYEEELFTVKDFRYNNIEKIEYCDEFGNKTILDGERDYGAITVYLKKTGMDEVKKAIVRLSGLRFVKAARGYTPL